MSLCEQFVTRTTAFVGARRGEDPFSFRVGRRPKSSCKVARGSNRQGGSCATVRHPARVWRTHCSPRGDGEDTSGRTQGDTFGKLRVLPLPDSLADLSAMIEAKTRELTIALSQHDGEKVALLSSVLATVGNKINMVQQGATTKDSKRRAQYQSGMSDDEFTLRSAPGEGRFAPY